MQNVIVIIVGIAVAVAISVRLVRSLRRPKSCCGNCPMSQQCGGHKHKGCCK